MKAVLGYKDPEDDIARKVTSPFSLCVTIFYSSLFKASDLLILNLFILIDKRMVGGGS